MIRINRGPDPEGFNSRSQQWLARFQAEQNRNLQLTISKFWGRIRNEIREDAESLRLAFHGKCAFCESRMAHVSAPHVEHYRPKSQFPLLAFAWENWLLSCGRCNDSKWAHFPNCDDRPCLIDPANEDPDEHIEFVNFLALAKTPRGEKTIRLVGLNRSPLEDERSQWLIRLNALLLLCLHTEFREQARKLLIWSMQANAPYSAMARCYLSRKAPRLAEPDRPHPWVDVADPLKEIDRLIVEHSSRLKELA